MKISRRGGSSIDHRFRVNVAATLEQAEYDDLAGRIATTLTQADDCEVALIPVSRPIDDFMLRQRHFVRDQLAKLAVVPRFCVGCKSRTGAAKRAVELMWELQPSIDC